MVYYNIIGLSLFFFWYEVQLSFSCRELNSNYCMSFNNHNGSMEPSQICASLCLTEQECFVSYSSNESLLPQVLDLLYFDASTCLADVEGENKKRLGLSLSWGLAGAGYHEEFQVGMMRKDNSGGLYCLEMKLKQPIRNLTGNLTVPCMSLPTIFGPTRQFDINLMTLPSAQEKSAGQINFKGCLSLMEEEVTKECENEKILQYVPKIKNLGRQSVLVEYYEVAVKDTKEENITYLIWIQEVVKRELFFTKTVTRKVKVIPQEAPNVTFTCVPPGEYTAKVRQTDVTDPIIYVSNRNIQVKEYDPCDDRPCYNGGVCIRDEDECTLAFCECDECYYGDNCTFSNCTTTQLPTTSDINPLLSIVSKSSGTPLALEEIYPLILSSVVLLVLASVLVMFVLHYRYVRLRMHQGDNDITFLDKQSHLEGTPRLTALYSSSNPAMIYDPNGNYQHENDDHTWDSGCDCDPSEPHERHNIGVVMGDIHSVAMDERSGYHV